MFFKDDSASRVPSSKRKRVVSLHAHDDVEICMARRNGRSSDLPPVFRRLPDKVQWLCLSKSVCKGGSQQRDCPGLSPGSLLIVRRGQTACEHYILMHCKVSVILLSIQPQTEKSFGMLRIRSPFHCGATALCLLPLSADTIHSAFRPLLFVISADVAKFCCFNASTICQQHSVS